MSGNDLVHAWAWCVCDEPAETVDGTYYTDGKLWFLRRDDGKQTDAATFDFAGLNALVNFDNVIHFVKGIIPVKTLIIGTEAADLTFVGDDEGTEIRAMPGSSAFDVVCGDDQTICWSNLTFSSEGLADIYDDGGRAIHQVGGAFEVANCTFENLVGGDGGAIFADFLAANSRIVRSTFANNAAQPMTGEGGAVFAAAKVAGVTLAVADCAFTGNFAGNGGAISVWAGNRDANRQLDVPLALVVADTTFEGNVADFAGGAVFGNPTELLVDADATKDEPGTTEFVGNLASWCGGAICLDTMKATDTTSVTMRRGVRFVGNVVSNDVESAQGGAIDIKVAGSRFLAEGVEFTANAVYGDAGYGVLGGAICCNNSADFESVAIDTCVFASNTVVAVADTGNYAFIYGAAVEIEGGGQISFRNSTFGRQNYEAVTLAGLRRSPTVAVTNCVLVGNGDVLEEPLDFYFAYAKVDMAYSAYGAVGSSGVCTFQETLNFSNRTESVYAGDTLRLSQDGFNPVAAFGLEQPEAFDFDGVGYGTLPVGYSMGAYETPTPQVVLNVFGDKGYDATTSSNGCVWTWKLTDTNGNAVAYEDLVPTNLDEAAASEHLASRFTLTSWVFGTDENAGAIGLYDTTNETGSAFWLDAGLVPNDEWTARLVTGMQIRMTGEIKESWFVLPVDCGDGETNDVYFTWSWLDTAIGRGPTNDYAETCGLLREAETNGYSRWQNYVMGIDGSNPTNRIATIYEKMDPTDSMITNTTIRVVTPIDAFDPPPHGTGLKPEYRLYNMTLLPRGVLPAEKWRLATADEPRFPLDLTTLTYGLMTQTWEYGQTHLEIFAVFVGGEPPCDPYRLVTNDFGVKVLTGE